MKILCICGSGMGTSMIMRLKLTQAMKELNIQGNVEALGLGQGKSIVGNFDVVLCRENFVSEIKNDKVLVY
ncbi:PTS sugar transporter subunit IIB, partial [Mycoplasmopsis synoviae]